MRINILLKKAQILSVPRIRSVIPAIIAYVFLTASFSYVFNSLPKAEEVRAITREAYLYANPVVDAYRIMHAYFIDSTNPEFKAPLNHLANLARVYTHENRAVQTPNSDTPYSFLGMDLRSEPLVLTVPPIDGDRYFSIHMNDLYTYIFGYIGTRTTGNNGGSFLIAGPEWKGAIPKGINMNLRGQRRNPIGCLRLRAHSA